MGLSALCVASIEHTEPVPTLSMPSKPISTGPSPPKSGPMADCSDLSCALSGFRELRAIGKSPLLADILPGGLIGLLATGLVDLRACGLTVLARRLGPGPPRSCLSSFVASFPIIPFRACKTIGTASDARRSEAQACVSVVLWHGIESSILKFITLSQACNSDSCSVHHGCVSSTCVFLALQRFD
jgi:hypothetical protein